MNKGRLLLVVAAFFPESYGGAERQALILAEALGRRGVDVTLVAPSTSRDAPEGEATGFGRIVRRRVRAYPNLGGRYILSFLAWTLWFRRRFVGREWRGVPVYVFHARLHAVGPALAAMANRSPLMIKLGGGGEASEFETLRRKRYFYGSWARALLLRRVGRFVANSSQIVAELTALGVPDVRIAAFPNGVVLPPPTALREAMAKRTGRRFVYAGRLIPDKRVAVLHEAAVALADEERPPQLYLIGDGPERDRLAPLAPGARDVVMFPGFVSDIYSELMNADFFVSASMREGQSNALLEAMSAGVIPVVYAASGVADVVDHGVNGFIVEQSTPEAFAQAMRSALALEPERRSAMAMAARRFAEERIGIDAIAGRTLETMDALAGAIDR